jgi:hypothetical protein
MPNESRQKDRIFCIAANSKIIFKMYRYNSISTQLMPGSLHVDSIDVEYHSAQTLLMESLTSHRLSVREMK